MGSIRLTQFSPGAGCGCKISPAQLREIIQESLSESPKKDSKHLPVAAQIQDPGTAARRNNTADQDPGKSKPRSGASDLRPGAGNLRPGSEFPGLLVGNESCDDAAVFDIGGGKAVISTTDFFTPIVDDPYDFGRIAATNALSDVYAMGGSPLMAIAILGWPLDKLPASVAGKVLEGARAVCTAAGIPLAGGHSISISEPVFGLAVTGIIDAALVKKNNTVQKGDLLFLTKPLGIGIVGTAVKKGVAQQEHVDRALQLMTRLNTEGPRLALLPGVHALTDVTGFGLLGHCLEMVDGSGCTARIDVAQVPLISGIDNYIAEACIPGGTHRNFASYGHRLAYSAADNTVIVGVPEGGASGGDTLQDAPRPNTAQKYATAGVPEGGSMEGATLTHTAQRTTIATAGVPGGCTLQCGTLQNGTLTHTAQRTAIATAGVPEGSTLQCGTPEGSTPGSSTPGGSTLPDPVILRLCDPQTSGGLLIAADPGLKDVLEKDYGATCIGEIC